MANEFGEKGRSAEARADFARKQAGPGKNRNRGARSKGQDVVLFEDGLKDEACAAYVVCCVDDTDDLSGTTSTGYVAEGIAATVASLGGRVLLGVTRHQLLLAEGVAYTSHNSAMCFAALVPKHAIDAFVQEAVRIVVERSVETADPGLGVAVLPQGEVCEDVACEIERVCAFGRKAKRALCTKEEAYAIAEDISWLHLSEHGGTGEGVIGALAGVGLRLSGADGRFRGKWDLARLLGEPAGKRDRLSAVGAEKASRDAAKLDDGTFEQADARPLVLSVADFCAKMRAKVAGEVIVRLPNGDDVRGDAAIRLDSLAKPVLCESAMCFVCEQTDCDSDLVVPYEKADLGEIGNELSWRRYCDAFSFDNDVEECSAELEKTCRNCLYRRWTSRGFVCVAHR